MAFTGCETLDSAPESHPVESPALTGCEGSSTLAPTMDTQHFPLLLDFNVTVFGRGFVAEVKACGRLLAAHEDQSDWWLYGVYPGAIA